MREKNKNLDVTGTLAYLEGSMNFLLAAKDRHSETASESIQETKDMLVKLRHQLYAKSHHFLSI